MHWTEYFLLSVNWKNVYSLIVIPTNGQNLESYSFYSLKVTVDSEFEIIFNKKRRKFWNYVNIIIMKVIQSLKKETSSKLILFLRTCGPVAYIRENTFLLSRNGMLIDGERIVYRWKVQETEMLTDFKFCVLSRKKEIH